MSKRYEHLHYCEYRDTETGLIASNYVDVMNQQFNRITDLEAKLDEKTRIAEGYSELFDKRQHENYEQFCEIQELKAKLAERTEQLKIALKDFNDIQEENDKLAQQLAESEKKASKKNDESWDLYLSLKQFYSRLNVEAYPDDEIQKAGINELNKLLSNTKKQYLKEISELKQQLKEKVEKLKTILKENEELIVKYNVYNYGDKIQQDKVYAIMGEALEFLINKTNQIAIDKLKKVKENIKNSAITDYDPNEHFIKMYKKDAIKIIDQQIRVLKGEE